jgi:hypothetical protein
VLTVTSAVHEDHSTSKGRLHGTSLALPTPPQTQLRVKLLSCLRHTDSCVCTTWRCSQELITSFDHSMRNFGAHCGVKTSRGKRPNYVTIHTFSFWGQGMLFVCGGRSATRVAHPWKAARGLHRAMLAHFENTYERKLFEIFSVVHSTVSTSGNPGHASQFGVVMA